MMDRLSQLQNAIDQLAVQLYSSLYYLDTHHDFLPLGDQQKVSDPLSIAFQVLIIIEYYFKG